MDIALWMQWRQELLEPRKTRRDVPRFFIFGVGAIHHLDVEIKTIFTLRRQRAASNHPLVGRGVVNGNRREIRFFMKNFRGQLQQHF